MVLKFDYSNNLISLHEKLRSTYRQRQEESKGDGRRLRHGSDIFSEVITELVFDTPIASSFNPSLFIPAGRSFFATIQKNVFSLLAGNIEIDPFIRDFGAWYEHTKKLADHEYLIEGADKRIRKQVDSLIERILVGKYRYEDDQDWIESQGKRVNLANASSGQQEALPMLLVMLTWSLRLGFLKKRMMLFIEEPEAHLFPVSQKHMVSLFGLVYNSTKHDHVITIHSPYILTAVNNMILAKDIATQHGEDRLKGIMEPQFTIAYEDVRAYTIENGVLVSIRNDDSRLIGENVIDSVSDEFTADFDTLVNLQAGIQ